MNISTVGDDFDFNSLTRDELTILRDALKPLVTCAVNPPITDVERRLYDLTCAMHDEIIRVIGDGETP